MCLASAGQPGRDAQSKWERELETAMASDSTATASDLKLTGYGDVRTLEDMADCWKVLDEIMRKEEVCVNPEGEGVEFSIMFLCRRRKDVGESVETIRLEDIVKPGMKAVTLWWGFRGEKYTSTAIVSDKEGVIYDNIGTNAVIVQKDRKELFRDDAGCTAIRSIRLSDGFGREVISCLLVSQSVFYNDGQLLNSTDWNNSFAKSEQGWECSTFLKTYEKPEDSGAVFVHTYVRYRKMPYEYKGYLIGGRHFDEELHRNVSPEVHIQNP